MGKFKHIDNEDMCPDESQHVDYEEVYRATKNIDNLKIEDFLPWNVEHANQMGLFKRQFKQPSYGMSLFTDLTTLKKKVDTIRTLGESTKAYAKGFTTIKRGVSLEAKDCHVEYYLFDYENNSPKDDFVIVEVR